MWQDQYTENMHVEVYVNGAWMRGVVVNDFVAALGMPVWVSLPDWPASIPVTDENDIRPANKPVAEPIAPFDRVRMRSTNDGASMKWDGEVLAVSANGQKAQVKLDGIKAMPIWLPIADLQRI